MSSDPRRGAALLTVLVFAAFLSLLAGAAARTALSGARAARAFADAARADALGRTAADALAFRLATGDAAARRGGAVALRFPGADVSIDYVSESARADANLAPLALIGPLLTAAGAEPAEAEAVAARIGRFRAEIAARSRPAPGGLAALRAAVDALGPAHPARPAPGTAAIRDTAEVTADWGLSDALARRLIPELTVSAGAATVDPVLADRTLLLALLGDEARVDDYVQRRGEGFVNEDAALALLPVPARELVSFKDSPAVRALVRVRVADRMQRRYEAVLAPPARPTVVSVEQAGAAPAAERVPAVVSWRRLP